MIMTLIRDGGNKYGNDGDHDSNESYYICKMVVVI